LSNAGQRQLDITRASILPTSRYRTSIETTKKITDSSGEKLEVPVAKGIPIDKHTKITALSFTGMDPMSASGSPERMR